MKRVVYCSLGMNYFGQVVSRVLDVPLFVGSCVPDCDEVYIVGMYDAPYYSTTMDRTKRAGRRIIHWCGSDVLALSEPEMLPGDAIHLCESDGLCEELRTHGIEAHTCVFPTMTRFPVEPLPEEPVVSVYLGTNAQFYGEETVRDLQEVFPGVGWNTYHLGHYPPEQMPELVASSSVYLRLTPHDGSANSAREFMEGGRRCIGTTDLPYVSRVISGDLTHISCRLRAALKMTEPDWTAAAYYHVFNSPERFLTEFESVMADA